MHGRIPPLQFAKDADSVPFIHARIVVVGVVNLGCQLFVSPS